MKNKTVRLLAVELLTRVESQGTYSNLALNKVIEENNFSVKDTKLLTTIVYGVIQHKLTLEYWLEPFIKKANKLQLWVKKLLLVSLYQMVYLDKIPDRAVFNESIEIAKIKGHTGIRKFVTGVLHSIRRNGLREVNEIDNDITRLSIGTSTPEWLVEELIKELGITKVESILDTINTSPKHSVRINTHKVNKQILVNELKNDGYTIRESEVTPDALIVDGGFLPKSSEFRNGKMIIQDESAMLAVESMDIQKDDIVLDACAAPGGKTTQIAEKLMKGEGKVWALDIHKHKVKLIEENANKLGLISKVSAKQLDARKAITEFDSEKFDKILVDAPCSGLGLMRRKPEVKYEKKLADSYSLHDIQVNILEKVAPLLKKGGYLTYSTCTILNIENQKVIDDFLKKHPEFVQEKTYTKNKLKDERDTLSLTIYPDDYMSDGFFIATLRKK